MKLDKEATKKYGHKVYIVTNAEKKETSVKKEAFEKKETSEKKEFSKKKDFTEKKETSIFRDEKFND